jgi:hypothetical protein
MLGFKGTLLNRTSLEGFNYPENYCLPGEYKRPSNAIHACSDPFAVFLYGNWDELWLVDLVVLEQKGVVLSGVSIKFLKELNFQECLSLTHDSALLSYYWVINFAKQLTSVEIDAILPNILSSEECVISWAENIKTHIDILKHSIITPRYAYLWKLEGFPVDDRLEQLADEYTQTTRKQWSSRS